MKKIAMLLVFLTLLCAATAQADNRVYSRLFGWTRLAAYTDGFDGYASVDGYGGVTSADPFYVTVISKNASVWAQPRTGSKKLGTAEHGAALMCLSFDGGDTPAYENGFYAVSYKNQDGWVNEDYVVRNELTITLMESNVPAYIAPDTSSKKVGSLSKLTDLRVIGFYDDFYIVNLRGAAAAYIPMSVLHRDNTFGRNYHAGAEYARVKLDRKVTLRTGPGREYPEIRTLSAGSTVSVRDVIDNWVMVLDDKNSTWAFISPDELPM